MLNCSELTFSKLSERDTFCVIVSWLGGSKVLLRKTLLYSPHKVFKIRSEFSGGFILEGRIRNFSVVFSSFNRSPLSPSCTGPCACPHCCEICEHPRPISAATPLGARRRHRFSPCAWASLQPCSGEAHSVCPSCSARSRSKTWGM